jgi:DNA-binding CsgD family transcriptional regulator
MPTPNSTPSVSIEEFTCQEKEVMCLTLKGLSYQEMAKALAISVLTIKTHKRNIAHKAQVKGAPALRKFIFSMAEALKNTPFILL